MIFRLYPLLLIFLASIGGSIYFYHFPVAILYLQFLVISLTLTLVFAYLSRKLKAATICAVALFWFIGGLWTELFIPPALSGYINKNVIAYGRVVSTTSERKAIFYPRWIRYRNHFKEVDTNILLYLPENLHVSEEDFLLIKGRFGIFQPASTPYQFDFRQHYWGKKIFFYIHIFSDRDIIHTGNTEKGFVENLRRELISGVKKFLPPDISHFVLAITMGMRGRLSRTLLRHFYDLGLGHLLAISGLHVGVIVSIILFATAFLFVPITIRMSISSFFIVFYLIMVGPIPSVFRAVSMAVIFLFGWWGGRYNGINALGLAGLVFFFINPFAWMNIGFVLSFTVTFFLLIMMSASSVRSYILDAIKILIVAQLSSIPLTLYFFNYYNLFSPVANLIVVPIVSLVILPFSILGEIAYFLNHTLAGILFYIVRVSTLLTFDIVKFFDKLSRLFILHVPAFSIYIVIIFYISLLLYGFYFKRKESSWLWFSSAALIVGIFFLVLEFGSITLIHIRTERGQNYETVVSLPFARCAYIVDGKRKKKNEYLVLKLGNPPIKNVREFHLISGKIQIDVSKEGLVKINGRPMSSSDWVVKIRRGFLW